MQWFLQRFRPDRQAQAESAERCAPHSLLLLRGVTGASASLVAGSLSRGQRPRMSTSLEMQPKQKTWPQPPTRVGRHIGHAAHTKHVSSLSSSSSSSDARVFLRSARAATSTSTRRPRAAVSRLRLPPLPSSPLSSPPSSSFPSPLSSSAPLYGSASQRRSPLAASRERHSPRTTKSAHCAPPQRIPRTGGAR